MVLIQDMIRALGLQVVVPSAREEMDIDESAINRPALQLAGFWKFFGYKRPQILGRGEMVYLTQMEDHERRDVLKKFFSYDIPCVIVSRNIPPTDEMIVMATARGIPIFSTPLTTDRLEVDLLNFLNSYLAPMQTVHGVLVDVLGSGILITGSSGVGKSEAALELIRRGHRLVADDVVRIKRVSDTRLTGEAPELVRHLMEIRGVGIIDVSVMYGIGAVISSKSIDMQIHLEMWQQGKEYDRLGLSEEYTEILGVRVPKLVMPIRPGRNVAVVLEAAVSNFRLKQQGYNAAEEIVRRQMELMNK